MTGEDVNSVRWIGRLLAVVSEKRWRGGDASLEPATDGWPEPVVPRSALKASGLPLHLLTTVLLELRLHVATELVEVAASGVVRSR